MLSRPSSQGSTCGNSRFEVGSSCNTSVKETSKNSESEAAGNTNGTTELQDRPAPRKISLRRLSHSNIIGLELIKREENSSSRNEDADASEDTPQDSATPTTPMSPSAFHLKTRQMREFIEQDDDDGFLYVLDCSSWVWKAGTCASETVQIDDTKVDDGGEMTTTLTSTRSFYPPARARHTATPITEEGQYTIIFGGYKTKSTQGNHDPYGDETYTSSIGQPINDVWQLHTTSSSDGDSLRFLWRRLKNMGAPPSPRWGHIAVSIGSGAMLIHGGCTEAVDIQGPRNLVKNASHTLDDCYVFHLGGVVKPSRDSTALSRSVDYGECLWVKVSGDSGLGRRVCAAATVVNDGIIIFGGCRGKSVELKDARIIDLNRALSVELPSKN